MRWRDALALLTFAGLAWFYLAPGEPDLPNPNEEGVTLVSTADRINKGVEILNYCIAMSRLGDVEGYTTREIYLVDRLGILACVEEFNAKAGLTEDDVGSSLGRDDDPITQGDLIAALENGEDEA